MNAPSIEQLVAAQRRFFASGQTLDLAFRKQSLLTLKCAIRAHEEAVNAALMQDLGKSAAETYMCETGMTLSELSYMISHLGRFAKKRRVLTPLAQFPSDSFTVREPYGVALIMAPWNYPFMLALEQLADVREVFARLTGMAGIEEGYLNTLVKVLGVSYVAELAAQTCQDLGEGGLALKVGLVGKLCVFTLTAPMLLSLLEMILELTP